MTIGKRLIIGLTVPLLVLVGLIARADVVASEPLAQLQGVGEERGLLPA